MLQVTSKLTTVAAGIALASLPVLVGAQSTTTPRQTNPTGTSEQRRSTGDRNSPQHHLDEAKRVLNSISASSLEGEARTQVSELRRHFTQLESAWRSHAATSARSGVERSGHAGGHTSGTATGSTGSTTSGTATGATAGTTGTPEQTGATGATTPRSGSMSKSDDNWMTHYQALDRTLDRLLDDTRASATGRTSGTTGTTGSGTSGTSDRTGASASADVDLDATVRSKLVEFRGHLEKFHETAMTKGRTGEEDAASASATSGVTGSATGSTTERPPSTATTSATGTTGSMTGSTSGTSGMATHPEASTAQTTTAQTRTSASATVDSATIARLTAQIDELLRGSASTSGTAGTTSQTTGTSGTVGTSGSTANATVCVDREKLEELRRDIQALKDGSRR